MHWEPGTKAENGAQPVGPVLLRAGLTVDESHAWSAFEPELLHLLRGSVLGAPSADLAAARFRDLQESGATPLLLLGARFGERETLRLLRRVRGGSRWTPAVLLLGEARRELAEAALAEGVCDLVPLSQIDGDRMARALRFAVAVSEARQREEGWSRRCSELEIRFEGMLDLIEDGVLLVDEWRRVRWASRAVEEILGRPASEVVGQPFGALGWRRPEQAWGGLSGLLGGDGVRLEVERPDGGRRRVTVRSRRLEPADGRGERLRLVLLKDQAPARQAAEERRLIALGRLAAGVGHDVNNLLTPVLGFAELAREAAGDRARVERYAAEIERSAGAASELVERLLQLARQSATAPVELVADQAVQSTLPLLRALAGASVRLTAELEAGAAKIRLRPGDLEQVLLNLVANAREAMQGGGSIRLRTRADEAGRWELRVDDDGSGIAPDHLARLFDPGFTTKTGERASGLGLWIVRGILEDADGEIEVESRPAAGSRVTVRLPGRPAPGDAD